MQLASTGLTVKLEASLEVVDPKDGAGLKLKGHVSSLGLDTSFDYEELSGFFVRENLSAHLCVSLLWFHLRYMEDPICPYDVYDEIMRIIVVAATMRMKKMTQTHRMK